MFSFRLRLFSQGCFSSNGFPLPFLVLSLLTRKSTLVHLFSSLGAGEARVRVIKMAAKMCCSRVGIEWADGGGKMSWVRDRIR